MSFTSIVLSGTINKDAESKTTPNGNAVTTFTISTLRYDNRSKSEKSFPVKVTMWGDAFAGNKDQYTAGTRVVVTGRLQLEEFTDRNGKKVRLAAIEANRVQKLSEVQEGAASTSANDEIFSDSSRSESDVLDNQEVPF